MTDDASDHVSPTQAWLMAVRPHTLPAAVSPVIVGAGLGVHHGLFAPVPVVVAAVCAMLIQAGTNVANDYFDAEKGVDDDRSIGFKRVTASGYLPPKTVRNGMIFLYGLAVVLGGYLVYVGGIPILLVGLVGILCGITYSGGPLPYGSFALGDLMVFLFFGEVAVAGTYYVQAMFHQTGTLPLTVFPQHVGADILIAGLPAALLSTAILVVNNLRDLETDRAAGKRTLAVLIGRMGSRIEYTLCLLVAYFAPVWLGLRAWDGYGTSVLLPLLSLPLAVTISRTVWSVDRGPELNESLSKTGQLLLLHSALFAAGLIV